MGSIHGKNRGRKSRDTASLRGNFLGKTLAICIVFIYGNTEVKNNPLSPFPSCNIIPAFPPDIYTSASLLPLKKQGKAHTHTHTHTPTPMQSILEISPSVWGVFMDICCHNALPPLLAEMTRAWERGEGGGHGGEGGQGGEGGCCWPTDSPLPPSISWFHRDAAKVWSWGFIN